MNADSGMVEGPWCVSPDQYRAPFTVILFEVAFQLQKSGTPSSRTAVG